jgi:hypothetical protein
MSFTATEYLNKTRVRAQFAQDSLLGEQRLIAEVCHRGSKSTTPLMQQGPWTLPL